MEPFSISEHDLAIAERLSSRVLAGHPLVLAGALPHRRQSGAGYEFMEFRRHHQDEDARSIDWRASARLNHLVARRFASEWSSEWWICMDCSASMQLGGSDRWSLARTLSAVLAHVLLRRGARVGLLLFADGVIGLRPLGRGRKQEAALAQAINNAKGKSSGGASRLASCAAYMRRRQSVIVLSDFLTPSAMTEDLGLLRRLKGELHCLRLEAPSDAILPADMATTVIDVETAEVSMIEDAASATTLAQRRLQEHRDLLTEYCSQHGICHSSAFEYEPWSGVLVNHLQQAMRQHA